MTRADGTEGGEVGKGGERGKEGEEEEGILLRTGRDEEKRILRIYLGLRVTIVALSGFHSI